MLDVRGWGRLGYHSDGAQRQDAIGALVVRLLNDAALAKIATPGRTDAP